MVRYDGLANPFHSLNLSRLTHPAAVSRLKLWVFERATLETSPPCPSPSPARRGEKSPPSGVRGYCVLGASNLEDLSPLPLPLSCEERGEIPPSLAGKGVRGLGFLTHIFKLDAPLLE